MTEAFEPPFADSRELRSEFTDDHRIREGVTPVEVLEALGFEWVDFATLPDSLMQVGKSSGYGRMDESLSILMKSPDGKTVYCFLDAGSNLYSWARYVLKDEVWEKDPMNHDSSIGEIITTLGRIEVDGWVK